MPPKAKQQSTRKDFPSGEVPAEELLKDEKARTEKARGGTKLLSDTQIEAETKEDREALVAKANLHPQSSMGVYVVRGHEENQLELAGYLNRPNLAGVYAAIVYIAPLASSLKARAAVSKTVLHSTEIS